MSRLGTRSQLRTNIPGDTRICGRFNSDLTILEGTQFYVTNPATGHYRVFFGQSATLLQPALGLIVAVASTVVAAPAANPRVAIVHQILNPAGVVVTGSGGPVGSVIIGCINPTTGAFANLASNDDICFECVVRDTEVRY